MLYFQVKTVRKALELPKFSKKLSFKGSVLLRGRSKKMFSETIIHKIFETDSSFYVKQDTTGKV